MERQYRGKKDTAGNFLCISNEIKFRNNKKNPAQ